MRILEAAYWSDGYIDFQEEGKEGKQKQNNSKQIEREVMIEEASNKI